MLKRVVGVLAVVVAALAVGWVLFVPTPDWLATHDVGHVTGALRTFRLQIARDAARGRLLTFGAGLFAAGALWFTGRNFTLSRRALTLSQRALELTEQGQRRTFELTEEGQVTDRYTKAIEQLGSDKLDVRIGGIYALERIARDSARDHPTVMEVLAAFIREHSREQWPLPEPGADLPKRATRPDVQAGIVAIGRRDVEHDREAINLTGANLTGANLSGAILSNADLADANLTGANLNDANLNDANLIRSDLTGAFLFDADLTGAKLGLGDSASGANLRGAVLTRARLVNADLRGANLLRADLWIADLSGARLNRANLTGANLSGANLTGAQLGRSRHDKLFDPDSSANLTGARLNGTRWPSPQAVPEGWVRDPDSGELRRPSGDPGAAPPPED